VFGVASASVCGVRRGGWTHRAAAGAQDEAQRAQTSGGNTQAVSCCAVDKDRAHAAAEACAHACCSHTAACCQLLRGPHLQVPSFTVLRCATPAVCDVWRVWRNRSRQRTSSSSSSSSVSPDNTHTHTHTRERTRLALLLAQALLHIARSTPQHTPAATPHPRTAAACRHAAARAAHLVRARLALLVARRFLSLSALLAADLASRSAVCDARCATHGCGVHRRGAGFSR
jgi:hypothetical protein